VWPVRAGDPRKASLLAQRFAVYDAALGPADELLKLEKYRRLAQVA
jgi:hypothetical protein